MDTVKCMNYADELFDTGIKFDDVDRLFVTVITGDEIISVMLNDGTIKEFDSAVLGNIPRFMDYWDDQYVVSKPEFEAWSKRKTTYDWRGKEC